MVLPSRNPVLRFSRGCGHLRFAFMPLGLFALIAVGVHAAADTLDDRILWIVDRADTGFDALAGRWRFTSPAVEWIDLSNRVGIARGAALFWEFCVDLLLALPALGYREEEGKPQRGLRDLLRELVQRPTLLRVTRPLANAAVVTAGACAVARMSQTTLYFESRGLLGESLAGMLARGAAAGALGGVLLTLGVRAVLRSLQHADELARERPGLPWTRIALKGLPGTALIVPLALAAFRDASPLLSFFR